MKKNKEILQRIAKRLDGIFLSDLTTAETAIFDMLRAANFLTVKPIDARKKFETLVVTLVKQ